MRALRIARTSIESATLDIWAALSRRALAFSVTAIILAASVLWWEESVDAIASPAVADEAIQQVLWLP